MVEAKKTTAAPASDLSPKAQQEAEKAKRAEAAAKPEVKTEAQKAAEKAEADGKKAAKEGQTKAGKINANLAEDGDGRRVMANVRDGKPSYFWANLTPTAALTDEEVKAVENMKAGNL